MQHLIDAAERGTPAFYKANLPVPYVLAEAGHEGIARGKGLAYCCPLHNDSDPSFDTWLEPDGAWRWNCPPCGKGGDVVDLIGEMEGLSFGESMLHAENLHHLMPQGWTPPVTAALNGGSEWDEASERAFVTSAQVADSKPLWDFCSAKGLDVDPQELRDEWDLGCVGSEIVIPYKSRSGALVAWKHRSAQTAAIAARGSRLRGVLYGEWRDRGDLPVLLCEGESDVWHAWSQVGTEYSVMGLPGAGAQPTKDFDWLAGRKVLLALDGDKAGEQGVGRWAPYLLSLGCSVEFVPVPDGQDLRSMGDVTALVRATRNLKPAPETIRVLGDIYVRPGKDTNTMLSNWRLDAERELVSPEGGTAYVGTLVPTGRTVVLASSDLSTKNKIVSWCSRYGVAWLGADRDAQALLAMLQSEGAYLPTGEMVDVAGLHGAAFVWPGGQAGRSTLVYNPPSYDVHLEQRLSLPDAPHTALQVGVLRDLHRRDVMDPVLGWLAAAPLRSLLPSFPVLAVTGSSGSGKTTLLNTVLTSFAGADISTNLTSTTKHALASFLACTNAFPVWFDEYRPGARKDTQMALEQLLRDAYTAQISAKGGLGEHWSEINAMATHAPIVVSGEDTFTETSHTERFINLPLPSEGKNPSVLKDVQDWGPTGLPLAYLTWLSGQLAQGLINTEVRHIGSHDLPGRQRANLGTIAWGWALLDQFVQEQGAPSLGAQDLSLVTEAGEEASHHNPIRDAVLWALDEFDCSGFVAAGTEDMVYVRVTSFVTYIERSGAFALPGRAAAVERYMKDRFKAAPARYNFYGRDVACLAFDRHLLD